MDLDTEKTKIMNIYGKLHFIQSKINGLGKDKAGNGYQYVTGDKVLGYIKPLMNELKLILKQEVLNIENTRQDYVVGITKENPKGRPKSEILAKVSMRFTWVDCETGEKDENLFGANGQNGWDKGVGSALTYGERYFLLKFFHIPTDEDDIDNPELKTSDKPVLDEELLTTTLESGSVEDLRTLLTDYAVTDIQTQAITLRGIELTTK